MALFLKTNISTILSCLACPLVDICVEPLSHAHAGKDVRARNINSRLVGMCGEYSTNSCHGYKSHYEPSLSLLTKALA